MRKGLVSAKRVGLEMTVQWLLVLTTAVTRASATSWVNVSVSMTTLVRTVPLALVLASVLLMENVIPSLSNASAKQDGQVKTVLRKPVGKSVMSSGIASKVNVSARMATLVTSATSKHVLMLAITMESVTKENANVIKTTSDQIVG